MLKVAIIGCGKIADQHAEQIEQLPNCKLVGVCDREELMARQLSERFGSPPAFREPQDLLSQSRPDVVHITTPPQTHCAIGRLCLEAGCHVYIEKPFTVTHQEARELLHLAQSAGLKLTVGHNALFSHAATRLRDLVARGYLGGPPVHLESYYCYDLSDAAYAKALLGDAEHWVRGLPGGLLHNTISHGISRIAEFFASDCPEVLAYGFTSPLLRSIGEGDIIDELRVVLRDPHTATTAYFTFSSQMRPGLHMLRVYGPKNGIIMDELQQTVIKIPGSRYKSYLEQFIPPLVYAKQSCANSFGNIRKFLRADFHAGYGMKNLIARFYTAIACGHPVPIPYSEILRTSFIMSSIFDQLRSADSSRESYAIQATN